MRVLLILTILAAVAWSSDPWPNRIPDSLTLCYVNKTLSDRFRRLPNSMENLVAIIRKIEAHPDAAYMTMGKLASTLLHRFRYDGIIDIPDAGPDVVPVVPERAESDKYRLQWKLVPGTAADFPEASLTMEEKCSLHWMLSYTVNHTIRAEDRSTDFGRARSLPDSDEPHHVENHGMDHENNSQENRSDETNPDEDSAAPGYNTSGESEKEGHHEENHEGNHDENHEENHNENHEDDAPLVDDHPEEEHNEEEHNEEEQQPPAEEEGEYAAEEENDDSSSFWRRKRQTQEALAYPLEGGVVQTKCGTVSVGNVLAGIAAGSEPQSALLKDLIKDPIKELSASSMERVVESIWVATLAGDIGQTSLLRTPRRLDSFGPRGQWNCSLCPREYKLDLKEHSMLTNAEFYGGIDGLLMAKQMKMWDVDSYLKLSAVLEMYYSEFGINGDTKYRGCNRLNNYRDAAIIDQQELKDQSLNAALIMYSRGIDGAPTIAPGVKPVDKIGEYVNTTMGYINRYIGDSNNVDADFTQCNGVYVETNELFPATYTDLTFVFDQITDAATLHSQKNLAAAIALALDIEVRGSRMEVASSKDGSPYLDLNAYRNKAQLACAINNLPLGYTERRVADSLEKIRLRILSERALEKVNKVAGTNTRAILFFITTSISSEKEKIKSVLFKMLTDMPDVHIMFATLASPEELRPFVVNFDRDIIKISNYPKYKDAAPEIAKRLATVGARLSYPECKDISAKSNDTEAKYIFTGYLNTRTVQYFRLGPEYFYSSNVLYLRFQTMYGLARYCMSTTKERPGTGDDCKTAMKAGDTIEFKLSQPCGKMVQNQCSSIYISAATTSIEDNLPCTEKECHTPDQVKFIISHAGMRCNSAVAGAILSNLTLVLASLLVWFLNR